VQSEIIAVRSRIFVLSQLLVRTHDTTTCVFIMQLKRLLRNWFTSWPVKITGLSSRLAASRLHPYQVTSPKDHDLCHEEFRLADHQLPRYISKMMTLPSNTLIEATKNRKT
jgi:hypothetical protein